MHGVCGGVMKESWQCKGGNGELKFTTNAVELNVGQMINGDSWEYDQLL